MTYHGASRQVKSIGGSTTCSSHIIFILAPNIFHCSHKGLFTFIVLLTAFYCVGTNNNIIVFLDMSPMSFSVDQRQDICRSRASLFRRRFLDRKNDQIFVDAMPKSQCRWELRHVVYDVTMWRVCVS